MVILSRALLLAVLLPVPTAMFGVGTGLAESPLAERSAPRGATLFTPLVPEETGVGTENRYDDPRIWTERYHEFPVGAIGTGIAIGDYDGDGRPDVFVVSKTESCRLFRNLGGWKFEDTTERAGVGDHGAAAREWKQGAAFADVNNDGRLDLYVCRFAAPNRLYLNQGDGTFREEAAARGLAVKDGCGMAAFCDYDRDGWLDVHVQTNILNVVTGPRGQPDLLFHNNGDGTFADVTAPAGMSGEAQGHSATWWDYDEDGWPDLYVANDFSARDRLYHNRRDGTFTDVIDAVVPIMPYHAMGSDLGDFNNDGRLDFFVADMARSSHEREQQTIADTRARLHRPATPEAAPQTMRNALYLNTGTGRCLEAAALAGLTATDWTWSVRAEDLDNDGRLDLHVTNGMVRDYDNADLRARTMAAESSLERVRIMRSSPVVAERHFAYRNLGDLRFAEVGAAWGLDQRGVSFGAAFGDLDGDGDLDLLYANYQAGVTVLRNDEAEGHRVIVALQGTRSNRFGVGAVVRLETAAGPQVRQLVLARGYLSTSEPVVHFGLGGEARIRRLTVEWPGGAVQTFDDLPADRRFTITEPAARADGPPAVARNSPSGLGAFVEVSAAVGFAVPARERSEETVEQPLVSQRFNHRGPALAIGDLDGDERDDVVIGGTTRDPAHWLRATVAGLWEEAGPLPCAHDGLLADGPVVLFDADGDGANDVLLTKGDVALPPGARGYQPRLLLNDGRGHFRPAPAEALPPLPVSAGAVVVADFDRDGQLDVFIGGRVVPDRYPVVPPSALLMNRGGRFEPLAEAAAPGLNRVGLVTAALASDVDGDGWVDLLVAAEWGGVSYWRNRGGGGFDDESERAGFTAAGTGWWTGLASADFNGDGRPDYVAGNVGLNTRYAASPERPALLYYGDFGARDGPLAIEAYYEEERIVPWATRRELGGLIPAIRQRFPRNDAYARATLAEIVGPAALATAVRCEATEFRSGVFLSGTDGRFAFAPLPRIAQIAPLQGVVAGDFDGDGRADIYAVQNSHAPSERVGRFSGGLSQWLRGDGQGHFTAVPPRESGLIVPGDAKALAVVDLGADGWPDFLVTRNDAPTLAYQNRGVAGGRMLGVRLRGEPGNPNAIGARVTLTLANGRRQTAEVRAGGGYFSQSGATVFFGCPDASAPRRIQVRWPAGRLTTHDVPMDERVLWLER